MHRFKPVLFLSLTLFFLLLTYGIISCGVLDARAEETVIEGFDDFEESTDDAFDDFGGDVADDFPPSDMASSDGETLPSPPITDPLSSLPFDLHGSISAATSYNIAHDAPMPGETDWRGISRLKPELNLEISDRVSDRFRYVVSGKVAYDLIYGIRGRSDYTDDVINAYEFDAEIEKAYVQIKLRDDLDLKVGRQIVIWGKSDTIRVVDILNPLDIREPGITDIEDLRLPLVMTRLDYYLKEWSLSAIAIHEIRFDNMPVWGHDFYPSSTPLPAESKPASSIENTEYALSFSRSFPGGDIAFYFADVFNDTAHIETVTDDPTPRYDPYLDHARIRMAGGDVNIAYGNFLLKHEVAVIHDIAWYNPAESDGSAIIKGDLPRYNRVDILFGFEYMGFNETMVSFDTVVRHIVDYDTRLETAPMAPDETETQWAFRISKTFMNETLTVELLASVYEWNGDGGAYERFSMDYDVSDSIEVRGGLMIYQSGDRAGFGSIGDNDRLFAEIEYSF